MFFILLVLDLKATLKLRFSLHLFKSCIYNLGFGVITDSGEIDDIITLDNNDRNRILATIAGLVDDFLQN
jgi:hypothetical protein